MREERQMKDARLYVFARFHAKTGSERGVEEAIVKVLGPTRKEPGCLAANMFRSVRDDRLFYIHSKWQSEAAFDWHGEQLYTKALSPLSSVGLTTRWMLCGRSSLIESCRCYVFGE
jgi:quinol monooxygenase YgiN